jgi:uncharacterized protein (DUF4415 family)
MSMKREGAHWDEARRKARTDLHQTTGEDDARIMEAAVADPDAQPWTGETWAKAMPHIEFVRRKRGKQKAPVKQLISLRLDPDVVEHFRATGEGWQSRINEELRKVAGLA